jgi:sec-independent protein translocase protein TatA
VPAGITPLHLVLILVVALIVLGPGKLPEVGSALGKSIREFRTAISETRESLRAETSVPPDATVQTGASPASPAPAEGGRAPAAARGEPHQSGASNS